MALDFLDFVRLVAWLFRSLASRRSFGSIGYGEVWLPPGASRSLGMFSPAFLLANGILSAALAFQVLAGKHRRVVASALCLGAVFYGMGHERSLLSAAFMSVIGMATSWVVPKGLSQRPPPSTSDAWAGSLTLKGADRRIPAKWLTSKSRLTLGVLGGVSLLVAVLWLIFAAGGHFVSINQTIGGISHGASAKGTTPTIPEGWVPHAGGGWIGIDSARRYIAGTLRPDKPPSSAD